MQLRDANDIWTKEHLGMSVEELDYFDIRADGDANISVDDLTHFVVPSCGVCKTGVLKPDVTFFGGSLDPTVRERALEICIDPEVDALLVVGSSLQT